jgi:hypothetical protein
MRGDEVLSVHGFLVERADVLMRRTENSPEEADLAALTDMVHVTSP